MISSMEVEQLHTAFVAAQTGLKSARAQETQMRKRIEDLEYEVQRACEQIPIQFVASDEWWRGITPLVGAWKAAEEEVVSLRTELAGCGTHGFLRALIAQLEARLAQGAA